MSHIITYLSSNISCEEMFDNFEKCGGKLMCDYNEKHCLYESTDSSIKKICNVGKKHTELINSSLIYNAPITHLMRKNQQNNSTVSSSKLQFYNAISKVHQIRSPEHSGFVIEYNQTEDT